MDTKQPLKVVRELGVDFEVWPDTIVIKPRGTIHLNPRMTRKFVETLNDLLAYQALTDARSSG